MDQRADLDDDEDLTEPQEPVGPAEGPDVPADDHGTDDSDAVFDDDGTDDRDVLVDDDEMAPLRGGTPVLPLGGPESLDMNPHPRATLLGIVAVAVLFLFAAFAVGQSFRDGEHTAAVPRVPVPRLEGRTLEQAQRELGPLKLLVAVDYQPNEVVPPGVVFDQRPVAGSKLEIGTEVTLVVSDGPAGLIVPDVRGLQAAEAVGLLQALGFTASTEGVFNETVRPGEVVGSAPTKGNRAVLGAPVKVLVSNGPAPHVVPATVGQPEAQGLAALGRAGVGLGKVTTDYVAGPAPGIVLSTDPPANVAVPRDFPVNVVVSGAPPTLKVPSVTGLLQASANSVLKGGSFVVTTRSRSVPFGDPRAGRVISQSIPADTEVQAGAQLQLTIGVAPPPPTTTTTTVPGGPTTTAPRTTTTVKR